MILAKNQGGIIGKTMTQNTTKHDKWEQCDTKHSALKTYLAGENISWILLLQPMHQQVYSYICAYISPIQT
jgi:hypothetical protein